MTVADIFTKGMAESAEKAEAKAQMAASQPKAASSSASKQSQEAAPPQGTMTISATLEQPEIVLVADVTKEDTNALFLKVRRIILFRILHLVLGCNLEQLGHLYFIAFLFCYQVVKEPSASHVYIIHSQHCSRELRF